MQEQQSNQLNFFGLFLASGLPATGLTVTIDVFKVLPDGTTSQIVNDAACTEIGGGVYRYKLAAASTADEADYVGVMSTAGVADEAAVLTVYGVGHGGVEKLDAAVSSRSTTADVHVSIAGGNNSSRSLVGEQGNAWNAQQTGVAGSSRPVDCSFSSTVTAFGFVDGATTLQLQVKSFSTPATWYDVTGASHVAAGAEDFHISVQSAGRVWRLTSSADVEATATIAGK